MFERKKRKKIFWEIGEGICYWRKKRGLTQKQLAERINQQGFESKISNKEISRYETGGGMRSIMFFRICVALEIRSEQLYRVQCSNTENIGDVMFEKLHSEDEKEENKQIEMEDRLKKKMATNINQWLGDNDWSIDDLCSCYTTKAYEMNLWDEYKSATNTVLSRYILTDKKDTMKTRFRDIDLIPLIILASVFNKELSSFLE